MELSEILTWVGAVVAALVAGGFVIKFAINKKNSKIGDVRITTQSNNTAGGDIIGGDSVKKTGQ